MVGLNDPEVSDLVCMVPQPGRAGFLEPGLKHVAMSGFDQARSDGQAQKQQMGLGSDSKVVRRKNFVMRAPKSLDERKIWPWDRLKSRLGLQARPIESHRK